MTTPTTEAGGAPAGRLPRAFRRPRAWPWGRLLLLAPLLALLPLVWRLAAHIADVLAFPWQIDYDEGIVLRAALMVAQGHNPYHAPRPDFFTSATYPPVYYLLNAAWHWLAGPTLLSGRLISLAATLAVAGLLAWWVRLECRSWLAGLLTAALWLSLSPVYVWGTFYKPDLPAVALTLAGLVVARRWPTWPALAWAAPLFALAFFTKQSALIGPLAVGLWLLTSGGAWLRFGLLSGGLIAALFALGNVILKGGLWLHLVVFQQMPWSRGQLDHNLDKLTDSYPWLLAAAGLALPWLLFGRPATTPPRQRRPWRRPVGLPVWYALAVLPAVLVANGRVGVNYGLLLDLFPPLCLLVGVAAGDLLARSHRLRLALGAVLSALLVVQAVIPNPPGAWYSANRMPSPARARSMQNIARIVEQTPGSILSEDLWLLLRAGKPVQYDDPFMMAQLAQRAVWDDRHLVIDLDTQRFALVLLEYDITEVTRSPRWSPAALAALRANYEILHRDAVFVHQPRSLPRQPGTPQAIEYGGQLRLVETAVSAPSTRPGGALRVMVRWQRAAAPARDYTMFIHLVDPAGGLRAQIDLPPGTKPTSAWAAGERAEGEYPLTLPADAPPGAYRVLVGLYDPASGQRLPATRDGAPAGDAVAVAEVRVGDG